jgi:branched-chain amino acid transport system substrate-binding protein
MTQVRMAVLLCLAVLASAPTAAADKNYAPGVTDTEIKVGQTMPYSGSLSAFGTVGIVEQAYIGMVNEQGGVNGRKIKLISLDDAYSPPKTLEQTRKLVEQQNVAFIYTSLGVTTGLAARRYLNERHIPQIFTLAPVEAMNDPEHFPWTTDFVPTFEEFAEMVGHYIAKHKPNAKIAVLYQNDEGGKEHLRGLRKGLGENTKAVVVKAVSYEATDATVDSQIIELQASGADTFYNAATPKFAAQAIRRAYDLGWKPLHFISYTSGSIAAVLKPAGLEKSVGIIAAAFSKDPTDPQWQDDPEMKQYLAWLQKYDPHASPDDGYVLAGYQYAIVLVDFLRSCGDDLSRENIMQRATTLHDFHAPLLLPGIALNTSPTDYRPLKQMRYARFNGDRWELLDEMAEVANSR